MSTEKPQIIITNSNGQEQSDSYQNSIFENVSEQQEKLFCRVTSSDNQPKNQQPNVEAIPARNAISRVQRKYARSVFVICISKCNAAARFI